MRNRTVRVILCSILAAVLCFAATGCLFEHNYEKDYMQVIATVKPMTYETYTWETKADGTLEKHVEKTYTTEKVDIYKTQLVSMWNSNAASLINAGYTPEAAAEYLLNQVVNREILLNEANALFELDLLEWTTADDNYVAQSVYSTLDSLISSLKDEVLGDHDEPTQGDSESASTDTTYPVRPSEDAEEPDPEKVEKWTPDLSSYLAINGDSNRKSLEREVVRRLVERLGNLVEDNNFATDEEKKWFENDMAKMKKLVADHREEEVYPMLYDPDYKAEANEGNGTYIVEFLWGESAKDTRKLERLQQYITDGVEITDEEILTGYNSLVQTQKTTYDENNSTYETAATGSTDVVYTPTSNIFFVKHILIPFSDAQTAELTAYKNEGTHTKEQIKDFRARLADEIVGYKHIDGEDDTSKPMSISQIFATVTSKMSKYKYNAREAERLFDDLIYDYNTDPGAFGNTKGYGVKYELAAGESETYMEEFAVAARDMYDTLEVGQVYPTPVVTDYGVHIMYLASKTKAGEVKGLYDYQTPGEYSRIYDILKETLETSKKNAAYNSWASAKIIANEDKVERFEKRYKDLYEA